MITSQGMLVCSFNLKQMKKVQYRYSVRFDIRMIRMRQK